MSFADLPAADRWSALDERLPALIAAYSGSQSIPADDELALADLAEKHGCSERMLKTRLRDLGAPTYRLGKKWMVRRQSYAAALRKLETRKS